SAIRSGAESSVLSSTSWCWPSGLRTSIASGSCSTTTCAWPRKASTSTRSRPYSTDDLIRGTGDAGPSRPPVARPVVRVGAPAAKQLLALQEGALRRIEVAQKPQPVCFHHRLAPVDLAADLAAHFAENLPQARGVRAAQEILQHLQLERPVGPELAIGE